MFVSVYTVVYEIDCVFNCDLPLDTFIIIFRFLILDDNRLKYILQNFPQNVFIPEPRRCTQLIIFQIYFYCENLKGIKENQNS